MNYLSRSTVLKIALILLLLILITGCRDNIDLQSSNPVIKRAESKTKEMKRGGTIFYRYVATGTKWWDAPPNKKYLTRIGSINGDSNSSLVNGVSANSKLLMEIPRTVEFIPSPDKKMIALLDYKESRIVNLRTGKTLFKLKDHHYMSISIMSEGWSKNGENFAYTNDKNQICIIKIKQNKKMILKVFEPPDKNENIAFSQIDYFLENKFSWLNNSELVYIKGNRIYAIDGKGQLRVIYEAGPKNKLRNFEISPSGKYIVLYEDEPAKGEKNKQFVGDYDHKISIFSTDNNKLQKIREFKLDDLGNMDNLYPRLVWSPGENEMLFFSDALNVISSQESNNILLVDLNKDIKDRRRFDFEGVKNVAAWSPDGSKIAFIQTQIVNYDEEGVSQLFIYYVKRNQWSLEYTWPDTSMREHQIIWSPDQKQLLFQSKLPDGINLNIYDIQTKKVKSVSKGHGIYEIVDWLPNL